MRRIPQFVSVVMATLTLLVTFAATSVDATDYYLDSIKGKNSNDGLTPSSAWQ